MKEKGGMFIFCFVFQMKLFDGSVCCSIALSGAAAPHYTTLHRDLSGGRSRGSANVLCAAHCRNRLGAACSRLAAHGLHWGYCSCSRRQSALEAQGLINLFGCIAAHKNVNLFNLVINLLVTQPWLPFIKAPKVFSSCNVKMYQL